MSEQPTSKKKYRRWRYIIDWRQQMGFTVEIVAVLCGVWVITGTPSAAMRTKTAARTVSSMGMET